ncbi:MAG TPA: hypothetical protein VN451_09600, partial [Chitinophagaceae bacterium]|nr:hypothetical protein [Chitinophagaceae bacterium]
DVTVTGYIFDEDGPSNTDHPFEVIVTAGNTTNQTSSNFYQTSPTSNAIITIVAITPYLVSDGSTLFNTYGDCASVSQAVVDTEGVLQDSIEVVDDYFNNTIALDAEQAWEFFDYILHNGVAATAASYNIDSNAIHSYLARSAQATASSIDFIKNSLFGNKSLDSLTDEEFLTLSDHMVQGNIANRLAAEEIGNPDPSCLAEVIAWCYVRTMEMIAGIHLIMTTSTIIDKKEWIRLELKHWAGAVMQYIKTHLNCL